MKSGRQMLGLVGPRGVGKTTMFLQYIKEHQSEQNMLYVSADYVYFSSHTLVDLADEFCIAGVASVVPQSNALCSTSI